MMCFVFVNMAYWPHQFPGDHCLMNDKYTVFPGP